MTDYTQIPCFPASFQRVPPGLFGEAVASVVQAAGPMSDEQAMEIVEAVFGPLRLLSPPPDNFTACDHAYFRHEGGWRFCGKDHDGTDDPEFHRTADTEWYADNSDWRAFDPCSSWQTRDEGDSNE